MHLATLPILLFGWQKEMVGGLRCVERKRTGLLPVYGDGGIWEPRLRGLGHAGKGADRLPWLLNDLPVTEGGAGLDHELCEM